MFLEEKEEKNRTINIIPLIDIIFLMLIFFMLATNFYKDKEIDFIVPKNKVELTNTSEEFLEIRLNEDKYLCNNEEMNFGELSEKFLKIWREKDYEGVSADTPRHRAGSISQESLGVERSVREPHYNPAEALGSIRGLVAGSFYDG